MENIIAGVDIGGTHVTVCLVDMDRRELLKPTYTRIPIDPLGDRETIIRTWAAVIRESFSKAHIAVGRIGIAMPGPFDYEKGISYIRGLHKYESLFGENVKALLGAALGILQEEITLINDASAYLMGEMFCGAGRGFQNLVGLTLGTGLGSASFYNNRLEEGDLYCTDFASGKAEDFISARWLLQSYEQQTGEKLQGVKVLAERVGVDSTAQQLFETYGHNLGKVLAQRYKEQLPEVVVIGGNIAKAWQAFIPATLNVLEAAGLNFLLKPAELGENAALMGASHYGNG